MSQWSTLTFTLPSSRLVGLEGPLTELAPDGMQIDDGATLTGKDLPDGMSRVILYVPAGDGSRAQTALQSLAADRGLSFEVLQQDLEERDWNAEWKAHYKPLRIGRRLRVEPVFDRPTPDPELISIVIDPGMAFGTGTHETTQLAATALEAWIDGQKAHGAQLSGQTLLDVGTGSGILSIAALKLGFGAAVGTEIDEPGLENTRDNAALNGVGGRLKLHLTDDPDSLGSARYPLVLANIISSILKRLKASLIDRVQPGGTLIVSGVLAEERDSFVNAFADPRLTLMADQVDGDWMALTYLRS
ncbi:MAG: 50S ribosomal protein L11 methyltransferase [Myxococcales bacterium]|nr:50S ribosomal protein L11 methyltransferase [Myxococcales bacterium]